MLFLCRCHPQLLILVLAAATRSLKAQELQNVKRIGKFQDFGWIQKKSLAAAADHKMIRE
jgi:hypothetical protein